MDVNNWSSDVTERHIRAAIRTWEERSCVQWELDVTILTGTGIRVNDPPAPQDRDRVAAALQRRPDDVGGHP